MSKEMYSKYKNFLIEYGLFDEEIFEFINSKSVLINYKKIDDISLKSIYKNYIIDKGGVTFSGGEPLLQSDFIYECAKELKKEGFHICIDTAGIGEGYEKLIELTDLFIVDVKSLYEEEYKYLTGRDGLEEFHAFMNKIITSNKKIWLRQVIVPGINDDDEHILKLAEYANSISGIEKVELLPYHTYGMKKYEELNIKYRLKDTPALSKEKEEYLNTLLSKNIKK